MRDGQINTGGMCGLLARLDLLLAFANVSSGRL
jgi:hypothetical protein